MLNSGTNIRIILVISVKTTIFARKIKKRVLIITSISMKRVIVISTSLRHGSNSDMLADQFVEGAKAAGNEVEKISLAGKNIQFCKGPQASGG